MYGDFAILVHYIPASPIVTQQQRTDSGTHGISFGGWRTDDDNAVVFGKISAIFLDIHDEELTVDVLSERLPLTWFENAKYDVTNPFGDSRQIQFYAMWTFDSQKGILHFADKSMRSQISFALMRERPVSMADLELFGGPYPMPPCFTEICDSGTSLWTPHIEISSRLRAFTHRLLRDFDHQWRHVLRNDFNSLTLRHLARAVIRIATLDFQVIANTGGHRRRGVHVWITDLPAWEPYETNIIHVGSTLVVLCQDVSTGLSLVRQHSSLPVLSETDDLCHADQREPAKFT